MSGFAGIFYLDGRCAEPAVVQAMLRPLERRGPHGTRVWSQGQIGLGHAQLHATPESLTEQQPFIHDSDRWVIVADVRLDDRSALIAELGNVPVASDSQLILAAYLRWGVGCVEHLLGDFAFVIWDRDTHTLFGARDHLGVKPFYYYHNAGQLFAFGSDPSALLAVPAIPRVINESRVADYLVPSLEGSDKTSTFYRDIFRLPPAHTITVSSRDTRVREYWAPDPQYELCLGGEQDYVDAFREIFGHAVNDRLRTTGPSGVMLSGGLDSAAVFGFARANPEASVLSYSCLMRDAERCCETPFVRELVGLTGNGANFVYDDQLSDLEELLDEHFNETSDLFDFPDVPLIMYLAAKRDGVHVMLDGVDGDIVASANALYLTEYSRESPRKFLSAATAYASYYGFSPVQTAGLIWDQGIKPLIKPRVPAAVLNRRRRVKGQSAVVHGINWNDEILRNSMIDRDFAARIGLRDKLVTINGDTQWNVRDSRENDAFTLSAPFLTSAVERYDRMAASQSVEARHPFLDKRVLEFCLALPLSVKQSGGWGKSIVRHASAGLVPESVRWRRPTATNLNQHFFVQLMQPQLNEMLNEVRSGLKEIAGYVNHASVSGAIAELSVAASQPEPLWKIYQALKLLIWLRRS
jgi:asparagine synthase (glutamine-hydrolysing)